MPLTWPAEFIPAAVSWRLKSNTQSFSSPLSGHTQTAELPGARWIAELSMPVLTKPRWQAWSALIARLRGQSGRVYFSPPQYLGPELDWTTVPGGLSADDDTVSADNDVDLVNQLHIDTSAPVISGAGQTGAALVTVGWTPAADVLHAGDYVSYPVGAEGRTLHLLVEDARSDSAGVCTLAVEPPIRTPPADGAALEFRRPVCVMRLQDDDQGGLSHEPGQFGRAGCTLVESF